MNGRGIVCLVILFVAMATKAQEPARDAPLYQERQAQVERLRATLANQIQLRAYDLIDELAFGWLQTPPFSSATPVVLADVTAPQGLGSGLEALVENHLAQVLLRNPNTNVKLAHCPTCQAVVVHSDARGTVVGRGIDQPDALNKLRGSTGANYALFIDFEAEGASLVLRARITELVDTLPIVHAKTLSSRTTSGPLLRSPERLTSASDARAEYLAILDRRGPFNVPMKLSLSTFAPSEDAALSIPVPIPWLQIGAEYALSTARAWVGSLSLGVSFIPEIHTGGLVQVRGARLLTGSSMSLTRPNAYVFVGGGLVALQGATAGLLSAQQTTAGLVGNIVAYPLLQTGLEVRLGHRIGAAIFVESMPTLANVDNVGNYLSQIFPGTDFGFFEIHSIGAEATFAF